MESGPTSDLAGIVPLYHGVEGPGVEHCPHLKLWTAALHVGIRSCPCPQRACTSPPCLLQGQACMCVRVMWPKWWGQGRYSPAQQGTAPKSSALFLSSFSLWGDFSPLKWLWEEKGSCRGFENWCYGPLHAAWLRRCYQGPGGGWKGRERDWAGILFFSGGVKVPDHPTCWVNTKQENFVPGPFGREREHLH